MSNRASVPACGEPIPITLHRPIVEFACLGYFNPLRAL